MRVRRVLVLFGAIAGVACGGAPQSPGEVALAFFDALGRDPTRTLVYVSDAFHRHHGLRYETFLEDPRPLVTAQQEQADPAYELTRARLGWITALSLTVFFDRVPGLRFAAGRDRIDGDRAALEVVVVEAASGATRTAQLRLSRTRETAPWRIDAIETPPARGLRESTLAFLISPSRQSYDHRQALFRQTRRGKP